MTAQDRIHLRGSAPTAGRLLLRGPGGDIATWLIWPPAPRPLSTAVLLLCPDQPTPPARDSFGLELAVRAGTTVLAVRWRPATGQSAVEYALGWLADHAEDLDTDPSRLVVLGVGAAATATAATACAARDNAWPVLARHVIALPDDIPEVWASPRSLSGVCDATVILAPAAKTSPYVRALVLAGVPVRQRRLPAGSDAGLLATIVATDLADLPGPGERRPARTFTGGPLVR